MSLALRQLSIYIYICLPNYVIKTFPTKIKTKEINLKLIMFELFITSKLK